MNDKLHRNRTLVRELFADDPLLLSPMAGVTDMVFRAICREQGADVSYCEFASAEGVLHGNQSTRDLIELAPGEKNVGIQLFGADPAALAEAAREAELLGPTLIDLNFGCPVKKVVKKNGGSALLCDLPLVERITRAVVEATSLPVTAKIRLGWSSSTLNYLEVCEMLEDAGACAITIHGRTRDQLFTGIADWQPIAEVKQRSGLPIIGNGDVWGAEDYLRIKRETACDGVMIARAAIGNPFIFAELCAARSGRGYERPTIDEVVAVLVDHVDRELQLKGTQTGLNRMKRHFAAYLKGCPHVAELRKRVFASSHRDEIVGLFQEYAREHRGSRAA